MFMQDTWSQIRLASSVAASFGSMLSDALDKEEELKLQLKKANEEEELNLELKRKLEKNSMKRKLEIMQECKEYVDFQIKRERKEYKGFEIKQEHKEYNDERDRAQAATPKIEWDVTPLYDKFRSDFANTLKIEECTHALALKKEEIKAWEKRLELHKAQVERLRGKRNQAKENVKSMLTLFGCTACIKIMSVHDLASLGTLMNMKPTKPFMFTLGSSIPSAMLLAIKDTAHEMGLPALQVNSLYQWDGVSCKHVGPQY